MGLAVLRVMYFFLFEAPRCAQSCTQVGCASPGAIQGAEIDTELKGANLFIILLIFPSCLLAFLPSLPLSSPACFSASFLCCGLAFRVPIVPHVSHTHAPMHVCGCHSQVLET